MSHSNHQPDAAARVLGLGLLVLVIGLSAGCELFMGPDLRARAQNDVALATAGELRLSIANKTGGSTEPTGDITVKDGFATSITGTALADYVLVGWRKSGGSGTVSFEKVDPVTVRVTLSGGPANIEPVYEQRPAILYTTPIGNNIAKNSSVRLFFNRAVQLADADWPNLLHIMRQGSIELPYVLGSQSLGNAMTFKPAVPMLDDYTNYVLTVHAGVKADIDFSSPAYQDVFFLNQSVISRADYTNAFVTSDQLDTIPPFNTAFSLVGPEGSSIYTSSSHVTLNNFQALDDSGDSGVALVYLKNSNASDFPAAGLSYASGLSLSWDLADVSENQYAVDAIYEDQNGNKNPLTSMVSRSILLDKTAPLIGSFTVQGLAANPSFVANPAVTLNLSAADPPLSGASFLGSGESANGVDPLEQKTMRFSNDGLFWSDWAGYATSQAWNLGSGADGNRTVWLQVRDGIGNVSGATAAIKLDTTAPSASVLLANGSLYTNASSNTLVFSYGESGSGLDSLDLDASTTGLAGSSAYSAQFLGLSSGSGSLNASGNGFSGGTPISASDRLDLVLSAGEGSKHLAFTVADKAGNSRLVPVDLVYDTSLPSGTVSINNGAAATNSYTVTLNLSASDSGGSGLAMVGYEAVESGPATLANALWLPYQASVSATLNPVSNPAQQTVYVWFKDRAGNISAAAVSDTIQYNAVAPTVSFASSSAFTSSGSVSLSISASANTGLTISKVELSNNGSSYATVATPGTLSYSTGGYTLAWSTIAGAGASGTQGARTVYLRVTDSAGNITQKTLGITYDATAPSITAFSLSGTGTGATSLSYATFNITVSDNLTSLGSLQLSYCMDGSTWLGSYYLSASPGTINLYIANPSYAGGTSAQGNKTASIRFRDQSGNYSATATASIAYDNVAPSISSVTVGPGSGNWTNSASVNVAVVASDATSGFSAGKVYLSNNNSSWSPAYAISAGSFTKTAWDMTASAYGGTTANTNTKTVYVKVVDNAGNVSSAASGTTGYDTAPPTATITVPASSSSRDLTVTPTPSDASSGIADIKLVHAGIGTAWLPYSGALIATLGPVDGVKGVSAYFRDRAGNVSAAAGASTTLGTAYNNLTRSQIVKPTLGVGAESADYMNVLAGSSILLSSAYSGTDYPIVYKTEGGQIGVLRYELSGSSIRFIYTTYASNGMTIQNTGTGLPSVGYTIGAWVSLTKAASAYVNLDGATWNWSSTNPYTIILRVTNYLGDMQIYYNGTNYYLYPLETARFIRF